MKQVITTFIIVLLLVTSSYAEKPRTLAVYKLHVQSAEHDQGNFDHHLHHMLYLSGVADVPALVTRIGGIADVAEVTEQALSGFSDPIMLMIAGLFIGEGPVVQVRNGDGASKVLRNYSKEVAYHGPLVVVVNSFSASL